MPILEILFAGFAGLVMSVFLLVLPSSFFTFFVSVFCAISGDNVAENLGVAFRQLFPMAFTCVLIYGVYDLHGGLVSFAFAVGLLWQLFGFIGRALTDG
ncbi:hypothetical protein [Marinobacter sp.]|uniref:hypothetical protein n=1 Tax=Marinobacter sp. TaxID=50741 RepID=UPI00258BF0D1|nr:hypothetical protein [Marinobacter sp.]MCW9011070.1 hypothetical protein [Marinobacter sp.]